MSPLAAAIAALLPGVPFADVDGTLDNIRIDAGDVRKPTQAEIDAEIARQANPVPATATSGDFVAALVDLGWYAAVDAAANAAGGKALALWKHASVFERHHPLVVQIAAAIGKTEADLDDLFRKTTTYQVGA